MTWDQWESLEVNRDQWGSVAMIVVFGYINLFSITNNGARWGHLGSLGVTGAHWGSSGLIVESLHSVPRGGKNLFLTILNGV